MIEKNVFGDIQYTLKNFFIPHKTVAGKYSILKREPWYITDPTWMPFWDKPPQFDSFVQAVKWLKEHEKELV